MAADNQPHDNPAARSAELVRHPDVLRADPIDVGHLVGIGATVVLPRCQNLNTGVAEPPPRTGVSEGRLAGIASVTHASEYEASDASAVGGQTAQIDGPGGAE